MHGTGLASLPVAGDPRRARRTIPAVIEQVDRVGGSMMTEPIISAVLAVMLWPLLVAGMNLHVHHLLR